MEHISVHVRIRPFLSSESSEATSIDSLSITPPQLVIKKEFTSKAFQVSSVLDDHSSQEETYETAAREVVRVRDR